MPHTSEPLFPQPLLDLLAAEPQHSAFEVGDRTVSYGELLELVQRLAAALQAAGLGPRSGVAIHTRLGVESFAAHLAAHALGCRVVGVRPAWSRPQLAAVLAQGVDVLLGDPSTLMPEVLAAAGNGPSVLSLGAHPEVDDLLAGPADADDGAALRATAVGPDDVARVNFTSGSTGRPKGCAYTYRTLSLTYRPDRRSADLARLVGHFRRFLAYTSWALPVRLTFAGRCLLNRGTVVILDADPGDELGEAIERHRISSLTMPVPELQRLVAGLRETPRDLGCLEALVVTGSPVSRALLAAAVEQLGPVVWQGYGQAESGMISLLTPEDIARDTDAALISVGRPLPDVEVSVRDLDDQPTGPDEVGEICVRSPHVMAGYWSDAELTGQVLRDGWLHTRDLGRLDRNGLLQLTGRSRDVIMVDAEVCYAGAIERVLTAHPAVQQAFVVGVPDDRTGEAVHAFVVLDGSEVPERSALDALIRAELTAAHVPATLTVLEDVPITPAGKPDKQALVALVPR